MGVRPPASPLSRQEAHCDASTGTLENPSARVRRADDRQAVAPRRSEEMMPTPEERQIITPASGRPRSASSATSRVARPGRTVLFALHEPHMLAQQPVQVGHPDWSPLLGAHVDQDALGLVAHQVEGLRQAVRSPGRPSCAEPQHPRVRRGPWRPPVVGRQVTIADRVASMAVAVGSRPPRAHPLAEDRVAGRSEIG